MFTFLKSFGKSIASGRRKAAPRRRGLRPAVEPLEDRLAPAGHPGTHHIDLANAHFALKFAGHDAQLVVASENASTGQVAGQFFDPSTAVAAGWTGQLTYTNTMKNGSPVEDLTFVGAGSGFVSFSGTVYGTGSYGRPFGSDQLNGTGTETSFFPPYASANGTVSGNDYDPIQAKYQALGGAGGFLGKSVSVELPTPYGGGFYQKFQQGAIYWSYGTGAHEVHGQIWAEYQAAASERDYYGKVVQPILGLPTSDETNVPGVAGARMNTFQGGAIYWSGTTGAHAIYGAIGAKYNSLGGPAVFGMPTNDEGPLPNGQLVPECRVTTFQGGTGGDGAIIWSPAHGAYAIHGQILGEYQATASETDSNGNVVQYVLGALTSDETDVPGVAGARMNTFEGGTIYWSNGTGAWVVYGDIGGLYQSMGGPTSYLGLPVSEEGGAQAIPNGRVQYFQNGKILWTPGGGAYAVQNADYMDLNPGWIGIAGNTANAELVVDKDGNYRFTGSYYNAQTPGFSYDLSFGLLDDSGQLFTFTHSGYVGGSTDSSSRLDTWDISGNDPRLKYDWAKLVGCQWRVHDDWNSNWNTLINGLEGEFQSFGLVVGALSVVLA